MKKILIFNWKHDPKEGFSQRISCKIGKLGTLVISTTNEEQFNGFLLDEKGCIQDEYVFSDKDWVKVQQEMEQIVLSFIGDIVFLDDSGYI